MTRWGEPWTVADVEAYYLKRGRKPPKRSTMEIEAGLRTRIDEKKHTLGRGKRVEIDGYKFPSLAESRRYQELKLLQAAGEIKDLEVHPFWPIKVRGVEICNVWLDFSYYRAKETIRGGVRRFVSWQRVVEDVKTEPMTNRVRRALQIVGEKTYTKPTHET